MNSIYKCSVAIRWLTCTILMALFSFGIDTSAQTIPVIVPDTLHLIPPEKETGSGHNMPGKLPTAEVALYNGQMLLHFSEPVSCEIQLVDMDGQVALIARMRDEDIAILDVSRLHGRFQLIIRSDHWLATKAYWFP